jgi:hypothetical protein
LQRLPSLLAAAIINMDGIRAKSGWSWIFILVRSKDYKKLGSKLQQGIFAFAFGLPLRHDLRLKLDS